MFRKITKRLRRIILSAMTFATASILMVGCGAGEALRNLTVTATTYDKTTIEDDLKDFDLSQYPKEEKGNVSDRKSVV